jgi:hypothetical protein
MTQPINIFTAEQVKMLKQSAEKLRLSLSNSRDPIAIEFLNGELGNIIDKVLNEDVVLPFDDIPHFAKMTRDYLPEAEEEYFDFYSLARYGKPAYEQ